MRKLDELERLATRALASLFENSREGCNISSALFIKRFMNGEYSKRYTTVGYASDTISQNEVYRHIALRSDADGKKFTGEELYWIGYMYGALCFLYGITPKQAYKLFKGEYLRVRYPIYHTYDISQAAERLMEDIGWKKPDLQGLAHDRLREMILKEPKI